MGMENSCPMWCQFSLPTHSPTTNWSPFSFPLKSDVTSESFSLQCSKQSLPVNYCWYTNQNRFVILGSRCDSYPLCPLSRQKSIICLHLLLNMHRVLRVEDDKVGEIKSTSPIEADDSGCTNSINRYVQSWPCPGTRLGKVQTQSYPCGVFCSTLHGEGGRAESVKGRACGLAVSEE